ncbi:MAG: cytidylate kinase family protein [Tannerellaceae bacterium]|nr:cytidylate kinase family protein [Tannerellaceae bacterium]
MDTKIAVSGELGSGKTVLSNRLSSVLGWEIVSVGKIQRRLAERYGMSTLEFNRYMESHPELDEECDRMVSMYGKEERPLILDSRMAWHFVPDSFKVHLLANSYVAAERILRDRVRKNEAYSHVEEARRRLIERKQSETQRFGQQYGVDIDDFGNYDLVVDTSFALPETVFGKVIEALDRWRRGEPFGHLFFSPRSLVPLPQVPPPHARPVLVTEDARQGCFLYDGHREPDASPEGSSELVACRMG